MRSVVCYDMLASREVDQTHCSDQTPASVEKCATHPCAAWIPQSWTSCSVTCGVVNKRWKSFIAKIRCYQFVFPYRECLSA